MTVPAAVRARVTPAMDRIYVRPLSTNPERNARETLVAINALIRDGAAHPLVRSTAFQILRDAGVPNGLPATLQAVHDWVQAHMPYTRDPGDIELLTTADRAIASILQHGSYTEDCDGQVIVEASLLRALLGPANVRTVIIKANRATPTQWSHIFLQARLSPGLGVGPAQWITLDPIMNGETAKRPKKPVGWHPPKFFAREVIPVGDGPTLPALAAQTGMAVYERGGKQGLMGDWIPAARGRGNAIAREDDSWFEELPVLPNVVEPDAPSGVAGWGLFGALGLGAIKSNTYAQQRGYGAIESHRYAQGPVPGYQPATVAEDPRVVSGTPWWAGLGTVGGTLRTHRLKTAGLSGDPSYVQYGQLGSDGLDVAANIIKTATGVTTAIQTTQLNAIRAKQGLPPLGGGLPEPEGASTTTLLVAGAAVLGLGALLFWSMSRRRRAA